MVFNVSEVQKGLNFLRDEYLKNSDPRLYKIVRFRVTKGLKEQLTSKEFLDYKTEIESQVDPSDESYEYIKKSIEHIEKIMEQPTFDGTQLQMLEQSLILLEGKKRDLESEVYA
jgi:hypothetical protein